MTSRKMKIMTVKTVIMLQKQLQTSQKLVTREMLMVPLTKCLTVTVIVSLVAKVQNWIE